MKSSPIPQRFLRPILPRTGTRSCLFWFCTGLLSVIPVWAGTQTSESPSVTITAGPEWVPLEPALEIVPGSALDFSRMGFVDPPAGRHGRVIARPDGQFAFAGNPDQPRRFYGVNFCFGAHFLAKAEADQVAERLVRLGYNTIRIHHYERDLTEGQADSTTLNPAKLDQFDYLMAALIRRGIYLSTDLYVSRSVPYREVGIDRDGRIPMNTYKILVPVHPGAFENWKRFTRSLLGHVNPYTGRSYSEEPALAWLSMINEGNLGNFFGDLASIPEWNAAWNQWLRRRYDSRQALADAWKQELQNTEDPSKLTVALPKNLWASGPRARDCIAFLSATERDMVERMRRFLRSELGCRALISNANSWTYFVTDQGARAICDYVDDHFYVDHPRFLQQPWRLPSRCPNASPLAGGATGGRAKCFTRLFNKPFTVSEYNYSGPGRFRGVGGILTGAMGSLQGWSGIWRFAYSHSRPALFHPTRMGYFDLASDPLSQAAERASLCLFLRGDMQAAPHSVAIAMTTADLAHPAARIPKLAPDWHWLAWVTRIGTRLVAAANPASVAPQNLLLPLAWHTPASAYPSNQVLDLNPYAMNENRLLSTLKDRNIIKPGNPTNPPRKLYRSETGEITIAGANDLLVLDTSRTAGGYAPAGQTIATVQGGVRIEILDSDATLWVSALDTKPIRQSQRLLVTHLTDLQNTEIRYAESERQTLLDWGRLPYLVRTGRARVTIQLERPETYAVWALAPSGARQGPVPSEAAAGALVFTVDVAGKRTAGARLLYEVAVK